MQRTLTKKLELWKHSHNRKPLIIYGARQVGKTYLMKDFGKNCFHNYHYFNFEDDKNLINYFEANLKPQRIIEDLARYSKKTIDIEKDLVIFDEIQNCPKALTSLKYFCEDLPEQAVTAAGSLLGLELNPGSYPVGKVNRLELAPMSFFEFLEACGHKTWVEYLKNLSLSEESKIIIHDKLWDQLKLYFVIGGLPEVVAEFINSTSDLNSKLTNARKTQKLLYNAYLADIAKHCGKENAMHIERIWSNIPNQLARDLNGSATKFKLRGEIPGVKGFSQIIGVLDWLNKARTIIKIPIANSGQEPLKAYTQENYFKLFMFDIGLLGAIADLDPNTILDYSYGTFKGFFAENFVAQEIAYVQETRDHIYSWKESTAEVEFLLKKDGVIIPIEVKSGWVTQAKSAKVFKEKYSSPYRITLSAKEMKLDNVNQVLHYPLYLAARIFE